MFVNHKRLMGDTRWYLDYCQFTEADALFESCKRLNFLDHPRIEGTSSRCKRNLGVFSDTAPGYRISKTSNYLIPSEPMPIVLDNLLKSINTHFDEDYNLLLVNEYANEKDAVGPHYDDPYGNGKHGIVTISLGATRIYRLISRETNKVAMDFEMKHGDVLIMSNEFQVLYEHAIPESQEKCGTRISLTTRCISDKRKFREHKPRPEKRVRYYPPSKNCLRCEKSTTARSGVCEHCYELNSFKCPKCEQPTGAPWLCNVCFVDRKKQYGHL